MMGASTEIGTVWKWEVTTTYAIFHTCTSCLMFRERLSVLELQKVIYMM
jgi:hypothetical protein